MENEIEQKPIIAEKKSWKLKTGIFLMVLCIPFFLILPVIPFLEMESSTKITISTVLLVIGEVLFYAGGFLVGKELFTKYKSYFNPKNWFKKKDNIKEEDNNDPK